MVDLTDMLLLVGVSIICIGYTVRTVFYFIDRNNNKSKSHQLEKTTKPKIVKTLEVAKVPPKKPTIAQDTDIIKASPVEDPPWQHYYKRFRYSTDTKYRELSLSVVNKLRADAGLSPLPLPTCHPDVLSDIKKEITEVLADGVLSCVPIYELIRNAKKIKIKQHDIPLALMKLIEDGLVKTHQAKPIEYDLEKRYPATKYSLVNQNIEEPKVKTHQKKVTKDQPDRNSELIVSKRRTTGNLYGENAGRVRSQYTKLLKPIAYGLLNGKTKYELQTEFSWSDKQTDKAADQLTWLADNPYGDDLFYYEDNKEGQQVFYYVNGGDKRPEMHQDDKYPFKNYLGDSKKQHLPSESQQRV